MYNQPIEDRTYLSLACCLIGLSAACGSGFFPAPGRTILKLLSETELGVCEFEPVAIMELLLVMP